MGANHPGRDAVWRTVGAGGPEFVLDGGTIVGAQPSTAPFDREVREPPPRIGKHRPPLAEGKFGVPIRSDPGANLTSGSGLRLHSANVVARNYALQK